MKLYLKKDGGNTHISHSKYGSMLSQILCVMAEHWLNRIAGRICYVFFRPTLTLGWRSCKVLICSDRFMFTANFISYIADNSVLFCLLSNRLTMNASRRYCRRMDCDNENSLTVYQGYRGRGLFEDCSDVRVVQTSVSSFAVSPHCIMDCHTAD